MSERGLETRLVRVGLELTKLEAQIRATSEFSPAEEEAIRLALDRLATEAGLDAEVDELNSAQKVLLNRIADISNEFGDKLFKQEGVIDAEIRGQMERSLRRILKKPPEEN